MIKLLLIDDDFACLYVHTKMAVKGGFLKEEIKTFENPEEALIFLSAAAEKEEADLWPQFICSDLNMAEMSGVDFLESFGKIDSPFPKPDITIVTGSVDNKILKTILKDHQDIKTKSKFLKHRFFKSLLSGEEEE